MLLTLAALVFALDAPPEAPVPVYASLTSSLPTDGQRVRQFALDGDPETAFVSASDAKADDHLTLTFTSSISLKSLELVTGRGGEGEDEARFAGIVEVSEDGLDFAEAARFDGALESLDLDGRKALAVRIRPAADLDGPLAIREVMIESDPPVATYRHPVEFVVNSDDAPDLADWAVEVAQECERWYDRINEALASDGHRPARIIQLIMKEDYNGVAMAGGGRITGSVKYYRDHKDDVGSFIHETAHVVQAYRGRGNPGWLVEGVADHVRNFLYEPDKARPVSRRRAQYNASYSTTAAFLDYVAREHDPELVRKLNAAMRERRYSDEIWEELTGKTVEQLGEDWRASLPDGR